MSRVPKLCRQRFPNRPDQAFVKIDGKRIHLGEYGSQESKRRYAEAIADPVDGESTPANLPESTDPTVSELILAYLTHAKDYYVDRNGKPSREFEQQREAMRTLRRVAGDQPAASFGPKLLQEVRQTWIDRDLTRKHINGMVRRIVVAFRWAASQEMIPASVHLSLTTVKGLRKGRGQGRDSRVVEPVPDADVEATLLELPEVVADMVRLQRLTGARPGEVLALRPKDLDDRGAEVWIYTPGSHKTEHHGKRRTIAIGPKAQAILLRYLARDPAMCCFRPCDSEAKRGRRSRATIREQYSTDSYRQAIQRAAERANVPPWFPHQLRHSSATEIRAGFGIEAARCVLGHATAAVTEQYAERDQSVAIDVARKIG